jgi:hypothetical protein
MASAAPAARTLLIVELQAAPAPALAAALGISLYEAGRRAERGGFHLHRVLPPAAAAEEAGRLAASGLRAWQVAEADVRAAARPQRVRGGTREERALALRIEAEVRRVAAAELMLIVRGDIVREYQSVARRAKVHAATLEGGHRIHLHGHAPGPPLEIDAADFEFTDHGGAALPSLLVLSGWVHALGAEVAVDEDFRRLAPALAPEQTQPGALGMAEALRPARRADAPLVLDNLAQFRFYSAWRALVERQRRAAGPAG